MIEFGIRSLILLGTENLKIVPFHFTSIYFNTKFYWISNMLSGFAKEPRTLFSHFIKHSNFDSSCQF